MVVRLHWPFCVARVRCAAVVGFALLVLGACSASDAPARSSGGGAAKTPATAPHLPAERLKLTGLRVPGLCQVGWHAGREKGIFAEEGLDVELLPIDAEEVHSHGLTYLRGPAGIVRSDLTVIEYQQLADIALGKLDYYVVMGEHSGCRQLVVPAQSPVRSLADLKGKRIGLSPFNDRVMWEFLARQAGTPGESLQWIPNSISLGGRQELEFVRSEFAAGRLDAYVTADPVGEILKADGTVRMLASNTWTPPLNGWYCCMIGVRRAVIDEHPEAAAAITRAFKRTSAFVEKSPAEAVALSVSKGYMSPDTRQDVAARLLGEYVWSATGRIEEDLERYFTLLIEAGRLPSSSSPRELVRQVYRRGE